MQTFPESLKSMPGQSALSQALFDHFATRKRDTKWTDIRRLRLFIQHKTGIDAPKAEYVRWFERLQSLRMGSLRTLDGVHGFRWERRPRFMACYATNRDPISEKGKVLKGIRMKPLPEPKAEELPPSPVVVEQPGLVRAAAPTAERPKLVLLHGGKFVSLEQALTTGLTPTEAHAIAELIERTAL